MIKQAYFQGKNKKRRYFEGWYFKCISADRKQAIAIIPGMAIDPQGNRQAFIQVINAVTGKTWYHHFPYPEFNARADRFDVEIENNSFNVEGLSLNVDTGEGSIKGRLTFDNSHPFPKGLRHPGIMGPFGILPFLGLAFPGFFAYFTDFNGITRRFATYNHSRLVKWAVDQNKGTCTGELKGPSGVLSFTARMAGGGRLRAPVDGLMDREIVESITAEVWLRLSDRLGEILFESVSSEAGMEICL